MAHKKIQPFADPAGYYNTKEEAIEAWKTFISQHLDDFEDGEIVTVRFKDAMGEDCSANAVVSIDGDDNIEVDVAIMDQETLKVVESDTAPEDTSVVWIDTSKNSESGETPSRTEAIQTDIAALNRAVAALINIVGRHEYAFTHTINPGDITNSAKGDMEDFAYPEAPEGYGKDDESGNTGDIEYNESGTPMEKPVSMEPSAKHILVKYANTLQDLKNMSTYVLEHEMVWCDENMSMYIKAKGAIRRINGGSSSGGDIIIIDPSGTTSGDTDIDIDEIMSGITQNGASIASIQFVAPSGAKYTTAVDEHGNLNVYDEAEFNLMNTVEKATYPSSAKISAVTVDGVSVATTSDLFKQKLYINAVYCGGVSGGLNVTGGTNPTIDEHSYNYCSHNFVELSNLTTSDISLSGITLQYAEGGTKWYDLPLRGIIKAGSTFLIRGAQCSVMDANTTIIKVKTSDIDWKVNAKGEYDQNGTPIQFNDLNCKFYLKCSSASTIANPYISVVADAVSTATTMQYGYIDLVGLQDTSSSSSVSPAGYENSVNTKIKSSRILTKYYTMDSVSQATKAFAARNNVNDWTYVDLSKKPGDVIPNIECYTPKASWEGKNLFFNKTHVTENRPGMITCSFGIQATDNGEGATRCFNWISKGYRDEYVWINSTRSFNNATRYESCKGETDPTKPEFYYNRIRQEATDGTPFTVHKKVVKGLAAGTYYYAAGPDTAHTTEWHSFTVRTDDDVNTNGFKFVQTSDQQGFNWEEYQVWKACADYIKNNETPSFMINTGDMAQNGNRINEWLDYFEAKGDLANIEEMATIGNNDLCPANPFLLGTGADTTKVNSVNITYYYTFEIDPENMPVFNVTGPQNTVENVYVPSLYSFNFGKTHFMCINSEIGYNTEANVIGLKGVSATDCGYIYTYIKNWCQADIDKHGASSDWTIAYCHEMPFTIITNKVKKDFYDGGTTENTGVERGGSRLNISNKNPYWFSRFCQDNNIRLVIGGHKHTQATTWPLKENIKNGSVVSMKPVIQVTADDLNKSFGGATKLMTVSNASSPLNGCSYPETWFNADGSINDVTYSASTHFCTFELVDKVTAPVYAMSQSSGYKHTSNKELPATVLPWERYYHPCSVNGKGIDSANATQKYPFYTIWTVTSNDIKGVVKKVAGVFNKSGKYNINEEGAKVKANVSADDTYANIMAVNGISQDYKTADFSTIITIVN